MLWWHKTNQNEFVPKKALVLYHAANMSHNDSWVNFYVGDKFEKNEMLKDIVQYNYKEIYNQ